MLFSDAGQLIHGKAMPQLLEEFIDTIVEFANGKQTCNERNDYFRECDLQAASHKKLKTSRYKKRRLQCECCLLFHTC